MPQSPIHVIPGLYQPGREKWLQKDNKTPSCRKQAIDALLVTTILQSGSGVHRRTCLSAYPGIVDGLFAQIAGFDGRTPDPSYPGASLCRFSRTWATGGLGAELLRSGERPGEAVDGRMKNAAPFGTADRWVKRHHKLSSCKKVRLSKESGQPKRRAF